METLPFHSVMSSSGHIPGRSERGCALEFEAASGQQTMRHQSAMFWEGGAAHASKNDRGDAAVLRNAKNICKPGVASSLFAPTCAATDFQGMLASDPYPYGETRSTGDIARPGVGRPSAGISRVGMANNRKPGCGRCPCPPA